MDISKLSEEIKEKLNSNKTYSGDADTYDEEIVDEIIMQLLTIIEKLSEKNNTL